MIVKTILRTKVDISRITYKDTVSYFNITLDDSVRKTVCRLYFNGKKKQIALFDEQKNDFSKYPIEKLDDIFNFSEQIVTSADIIDKRYSKA